MIELLNGRTFPSQAELLNIPIVWTAGAQKIVWDAFPDRVSDRLLLSRLGEQMLSLYQRDYMQKAVFDRQELGSSVYAAKVTGGELDASEDARRLIMYFSVDPDKNVVLMVMQGYDPEIVRKKLRDPDFLVGVSHISSDIVALNPIMAN